MTLDKGSLRYWSDVSGPHERGFLPLRLPPASYGVTLAEMADVMRIMRATKLIAARVRCNGVPPVLPRKSW